ncbi:hypothetical protein [Tenacibaculum jejuense]|uniref:Uncharacterized protein n=1 Tax=Tenacibaculum jejuense TaxID=584609 RepID=A0A238U510_9FLAO|nr:hypothetical protein [Tenacibaculum jejuense]SNR14106.1 conserved protein of unknown function [Tenacibaculum jejuense]
MNMFRETPQIGQEILNVPMGEMIQQMAESIAEAQLKLDSNSIEVAEMMGGLKAITTEVDGKEVITFEDSRVFFGSEKVKVSDAVIIYNNTTDDATKHQIFNEAGTGKNTDKFEADGSTGNIKLKGATDENAEIIIPSRKSMLELGFSPTFYQFVDTILKVTMGITFTREGSSSREYSRKSEQKGGSFGFGFRRGFRSNRTVSTTQVNASHSQKYSYSAEASSLLQTKLVPIPPPAILEERIRKLMELNE